MTQRDQLKRIIAIDRAIRARQYPNPASLAGQLGVKERVIYNDRRYMIDDLDAPIAHCKQRGGWYYSQPTWTLLTMLMTEEEILAFALAIEAGRRPMGAVLHDKLDTARDKIAGALGGQVLSQMDTLSQHVTFAPSPASAANANYVLEIHRAIVERRRLRMTYFSARSNETKSRTVEPHHLHNDAGEWRVFAFDLKLNAIRTFNVARISQLKVEEKQFARQPNFDSNTFLNTSFRQQLGTEVFSVKIRFNAQQKPYVIDKQWHSTQRIEDNNADGVTLCFEVSHLEEVARWVLGYGAGAQVLQPAELRDLVRNAARDTLALYEEPNQP